MTQLQLALGFAVVAVCSLTVPRLAADSSTVSVAFSKDETTVTIRRGTQTWELVRPVVSPWKYKTEGQLYWVAPDGNDAGFGSEDKPFRTIQRAQRRTVPGDIVYVKPGTYHEYVEIHRSGSEGKPIIISCAPGALGKVKLAPPQTPSAKDEILSGFTIGGGAKHLWINGFVIEGARDLPKGAPAKDHMEGVNGISWVDKAGIGCRATNNVVYGNAHCGIKEMGHGGKQISVEGNVIFDNGRTTLDHGIYMPADDAILNGNIIFDHAGFGVHSYSNPSRQVITRNVCFDNRMGGIVIAGTDTKVYNNTFVNNARGIFYYGSSKNNIVRNNLCAFNRADNEYGHLPRDLDVGDIDDHNCYFPGKIDKRLKHGPAEVLADPLLRDVKKADFRLKAGSPCLEAGIDVGLPYKGRRPTLGAY